MKYILTKIFQIEIKTSEQNLFNYIAPPKDLPRIFSKKSYDCDSILENNLKEKIILKDEGELFSTYKALYPFDKEIALELLKDIGLERGKMYLFENIFILFPDYLDLNLKTFNALMSEEGYLPIVWRYYIAIMVNFNI